MTTHHTELRAPWNHFFDREGPETTAVIRDADGYDLVYSDEFRIPKRNKPIPQALAAVRVMTAAPELLEALETLLDQTVEMDLRHGIALSEGEQFARMTALKAIKKARGV